MLNTRKFAMWAAAGLMAVGVVMGVLPGVTQVASAATATPTPVATDKTAPERTKTSSDTYLAEALGITTDQLSAAKETARLAAIQQALDKGLITQAQADALKSKERAGGKGGATALIKDSDIDEDALLAKALGITVEKLDQAQETAKELKVAADIASGKITQEQADLAEAKSALRTYLAEKNIYANAVAQAVKDGIITQAQADAILAETSDKSGFGDLGGRGGGRGGRGGR